RKDYRRFAFRQQCLTCHRIGFGCIGPTREEAFTPGERYPTLICLNAADASGARLKLPSAINPRSLPPRWTLVPVPILRHAETGALGALTIAACCWRARKQGRGDQYRALPGVRGNGIASRTLERPVT